MSGERGFQYETSIYNMLMENDLTTSKYRPASSGHGADAAFKVKNKFYKLEVKLSLDADFGQATLRYDIDNYKWVTYSESESMREIIDAYKVDEFAQSVWKAVPYNHFKSSEVNKRRPKRRNMSTFEKSEDKKNFKDAFKELRENRVAQYYNSKDVYYIQIGYDKGFYYMGKDIANLGVPEFKPNQKIRIRRKPAGGSKYTFASAILVDKRVDRSPYNLDYNAIFLLNKNRE